MYTGRYHFNAFEFFARRPGHHVDAEFHAGRNVEEKRRRAVREQFHGPLLVHGRRLRAQRARRLPRDTFYVGFQRRDIDDFRQAGRTNNVCEVISRNLAP